jgi:uncharacterized protein
MTEKEFASGWPRLTGYAALFDIIDKGRDSIAPGAFRASLARRPILPLLWQHEAHQPVGRILSAIEDGQGLKITAHLAVTARGGRDAWSLVRAGAVHGLSIGYRTRRAVVDPATGVRRLTDLDLIEISLVTFPMQPGARVLGTDMGPVSRVARGIDGSPAGPRPASDLASAA